jgi:hypothetical protein
MHLHGHGTCSYDYGRPAMALLELPFCVPTLHPPPVRFLQTLSMQSVVVWLPEPPERGQRVDVWLLVRDKSHEIKNI